MQNFTRASSGSGSGDGIEVATYLELLHELLRRGGEHDDAARAGVDEPFLHRLVDEGQQRVVVPVHVQQPNLKQGTWRSDIFQPEARKDRQKDSPYWLVMDAKLRPCNHFEQLLQRTIASCIHSRHTTHMNNLLLVRCTSHNKTCNTSSSQQPDTSMHACTCTRWG